MANFFELVKEQELDMSELDQRMEIDADLLHLAHYIMRGPPDVAGVRHAIPGIVNSTLNKPAIFGATVVSSLAAVTQQVIVESDKEGFDTHNIEEFLEKAMDGADDRLRKKRLPLLNLFTDAQVCFRGRTGRRILFREENGILIPDITNWDGRYIRFKIGEDGFDWAAYSTRRSRAEIEADYDISINGKFAKVLDVWDKEHNEVWIDERQVKEQVHNYGYVPVVMGIVPLGWGDMLLDERRMKYEGESIFFMIRDVIPQLNMLMSILSTLNLLSVKRPSMWLSQKGTQAEPPDYDEAMSPGSLTPVDTEGGIKTIDFGDALRAAEMANNMLEKAIQEGSFTDIDIGNVKQPFSAVALIEIGEGRNQLLLPRLATKERLNIDTAEMIIRQVIQIGGTVELGAIGHKKKFGTSSLNGEYSIDYKYFIKSPKIDIARMSVAEQAKAWYPRKHIYEEVLQVEDPEEMTQEWYSELAEMIDPNVLKLRIVLKLLEKADEGDEDAEMEAFVMAQGMTLTIEQIKAGIVPDQPTLPEPEAAVPLVPEGDRVGGTVPSSAKKAGELTQQPKEGL